MLHQIIKFVAPKGEETLSGDQVAAKLCYLAIVCTKATMKVQLIESPRSVKKKVRYELDGPGSGHYFHAQKRNKR